MGHQRVAPFCHITSFVDIALQADACRLQMLLVVVLLLRASEVQISQHGTHRAERRMVRILFDEVQRQYALKHTQLVNVSVHHVRWRVLVHIGGT